LRRRRDGKLGRCLGCGKDIRAGTDFARVRGGLMHAACAEAPLRLAVAG
jgi:hypothetical protein